MLTTQEREYMHLYVGEEFTHDYHGYAQELARGRGIVYDHFARMWPFYMKNVGSIGRYPAGTSPSTRESDSPLSLGLQGRVRGATGGIGVPGA